MFADLKISGWTTFLTLLLPFNCVLARFLIRFIGVLAYSTWKCLGSVSGNLGFLSFWLKSFERRDFDSKELTGESTTKRDDADNRLVATRIDEWDAVLLLRIVVKVNKLFYQYLIWVCALVITLCRKVACIWMKVLNASWLIWGISLSTERKEALSIKPLWHESDRNFEFWLIARPKGLS